MIKENIIKSASLACSISYWLLIILMSRPLTAGSREWRMGWHWEVWQDAIMMWHQWWAWHGPRTGDYLSMEAHSWHSRHNQPRYQHKTGMTKSMFTNNNHGDNRYNPFSPEVGESSLASFRSLCVMIQNRFRCSGRARRPDRCRLQTPREWRLVVTGESSVTESVTCYMSHSECWHE